jgi:hypothetical protein
MAQADSQQAVQPIIDWAKGVVHPAVKLTDFLNEFPREGEDELNGAADAIKNRSAVGADKAKAAVSSAAQSIRDKAAALVGTK